VFVCHSLFSSKHPKTSGAEARVVSADLQSVTTVDGRKLAECASEKPPQRQRQMSQEQQHSSGGIDVHLVGYNRS